MKIHKLPKEVYDLIAAGEVVLGPVSVVKELVENSIDAGASRIVVDIACGGKERIRVSDNGSGIDKEDVCLAFAPHATSKLYGADELDHIETLGFRGEALASISAVARVLMVTRTSGEKTGSSVVTEGGSAPDISPAGAGTGTDVLVERLFFNIPARKKHMGNDSAEGRKIIEYLSKAAVSRADISFKLISDGKLVFSTTGKGDRLAAIAALYGSKTAENLIPVISRSDNMQLDGYISGVLGLRNNRKGQHFFVNGRPVKNPVFESAISGAYREFAEPGRFPVVFLFLSIDPTMVDVNVHPAKNEVSFVDKNEILDFISTAIKETLNSPYSVPKIKPSAFLLKNIETEENIDNVIVSTSGGNGDKVESVDIKHILSANEDTYNYKKGSMTHNEDKNHQVNGNKLRYSDYYEAVSKNTVPGSNCINIEFAEKIDENYEKSLNINGFSTIANLFATYILATDGDSFYIIDQHAAHERINYERFTEEYNNAGVSTQVLMEPYLFSPPVSVENMNKHIKILEELGYQIDEFGDKTWACRTFPAFVEWNEGEAFLLEILDSLAEEKNEINLQALERVIIRACKSSVKANKNLTEGESSQLLKQLSMCKNPYTCPHGRPVFLKLTKYDIEKLFKRA